MAGKKRSTKRHAKKLTVAGAHLGMKHNTSMKKSRKRSRAKRA